MSRTPAKRSAPAPASIRVTLLCTLSGGGETWSPGTVIEVDAAEGKRLIGLGAAQLFAAPQNSGAA